jgi:hypothetical protein
MIARPHDPWQRIEGLSGAEAVTQRGPEWAFGAFAEATRPGRAYPRPWQHCEQAISQSDNQTPSIVPATGREAPLALGACPGAPNPSPAQ